MLLVGTQSPRPLLPLPVGRGESWSLDISDTESPKDHAAKHQVDGRHRERLPFWRLVTAFESGGKPHAVQTLREFEGAFGVAKRLDCVCPKGTS